MRVWKAKPHLNLNLAREVKGTRITSTNVPATQGIPGKMVTLHMNRLGYLVTKYMDKAEVLLRFAFRNPKSLRPMGTSGEKMTYCW